MRRQASTAELKEGTEGRQNEVPADARPRLTPTRPGAPRPSPWPSTEQRAQRGQAAWGEDPRPRGDTPSFLSPSPAPEGHHPAPLLAVLVGTAGGGGLPSTPQQRVGSPSWGRAGLSPSQPPPPSHGTLLGRGPALPAHRGRAEAASGGSDGARRCQRIQHNTLFPEKGQRVQQHERSYSAAGAGTRSRGRADAEATKHLQRAQFCPRATPRGDQAPCSGLSTIPLSAPGGQEAGPVPLAESANATFSGGRV